VYERQKFATSSGPKARAGFIAAPVSGPPHRMPIVTTRPIPKPATALNAPRGSTAVAKTASTRKKVRIASSTSPAPCPIAEFSAGAPMCDGSVACVGKIHQRSSAAHVAPANCSSQ
jgi:hypothetical protein